MTVRDQGEWEHEARTITARCTLTDTAREIIDAAYEAWDCDVCESMDGRGDEWGVPPYRAGQDLHAWAIGAAVQTMTEDPDDLAGQLREATEEIANLRSDLRVKLARRNDLLVQLQRRGTSWSRMRGLSGLRHDGSVLAAIRAAETEAA